MKKQEDRFAHVIRRARRPREAILAARKLRFCWLLRAAAGCLLDVWQLVVHTAAEECRCALHPHRKECEVGAWYASATSRHDMQLLAHTVSKAT